MGKHKYYLNIQLLVAFVLLAPRLSFAEDIFIDCSRPGTPQDQCMALYAEQAFLPTTSDNNSGIYQKIPCLVFNF